MKWACIVQCSILLSLAGPAGAQEVRCVSTGQLERALQDGYGEMPWWAGPARDGALLVLAAEPSWRTWTLYVRRPDGTSCILAAGADGQRILPREQPETP